VIARQIGGMTEQRAEKLLKAAMKAIPLVAERGPMDVIYEDDIMLGLNKPPFVITAPKHRFEGGSLVNRVLGNTGKMPYVVHRLDMNTSGVLLFAKNSETASLLHEQFRNKTPRKTYLALVLGIPDWDETTLDAPIGRNTIEKYDYIYNITVSDQDMFHCLMSWRLYAGLQDQ
jgi:23S rRNA-/tRNA-specific pseudouridylate synthase